MNELHDENSKFKKGHPKVGGRQKGTLSINDELRKLLKQKDANGKPYIETFARQIFAEALKGNERLIIELWQQIDGKARQAVDVGGQKDNPILHSFTDISSANKIDNEPIENTDDE